MVEYNTFGDPCARVCVADKAKRKMNIKLFNLMLSGNKIFSSE